LGNTFVARLQAEGHITPSTASEEGFGDSQRQAGSSESSGIEHVQNHSVSFFLEKIEKQWKPYERAS